jgi:phage tail sheath protein FI
MPETLVPGLFVEETSFRQHMITPADTTASCFVGMALNGPGGVSVRLSSITEFEALYGGRGDLMINGIPSTNFLAHAVHGFFGNGGRALYIARAQGPGAAAYQAALDQSLAVDDISIIAAPGASALTDADAICAALTAHVERPGVFRFAVLDPPPGASMADIRAFRAGFDSSRAALYYPWLRIPGPAGAIDVPPSGHVSGIYVRSDTDGGVHKAPANEVISGITGFVTAINKPQQEILNPEGINVLRFFEGRGNRVWGARTMSGDPEWKYVNLRRYFDYLERSISRGTQWCVFEPNGEPLWANVRRTIADFLLSEWQNGALLGDKPEKAFFVKCDRSTMTQNDLDQGRLVCLIGVAALRPAEFVIFRISAMTADAQA